MIKDQEDSPETVGAQGGVLGDGVVELHNLQGGGDEPKLKGWTNQTNLLEQQHNSKETWCRCASALNRELPDHVWKNPKALTSKELDTILSLWLFHFEERIVTEKPITQESFSKNNLRVER